MFLYDCNAAIVGLDGSTQLSAAVKNQLKGEALFVRALMHFYLASFFGDVPVQLTTDYRVNAVLSRTAQQDVYAQVIKDLEAARLLMADKFVALDLVTSTTERIRPNKWAATALLARAYLYYGDYAKAAAMADSVISKTDLFGLEPDLTKVFLKNSVEAIWQLQPANSVGGNTPEGSVLILTTIPVGGHPYSMSPYLYGAFETGDVRKQQWVGTFTSGSDNYYFPYKYRVGVTNANSPVTEYTMVLRLAEQYLIRAEARARQHDLSGADADINVIRARAGLDPISSVDQTDQLKNILQERRVELFCEGAHRWFDLRRFGALDTVMPAVTLTKGGTWNDNWKLYPIPDYEILANSNLTQNPGY
jgi:hypothetical protein